MNIKKSLSVVLAIIVSTSLFAQEQEKKIWTLEECVSYAYENNLNIKRSELSLEGNEVTLKENRLSRLPDLNLGLYNNWRWGRSIDPTTNQFTTERINSNGFSGSSSVALYAGNRQVNAVKQSRIDTQASLYDLEKSKNDVALDVVAYYLNVIFAKELLENSKEQLSTTELQLGQTEKKVNAGSLPKTNLLDLQAQVASHEVDVINNENSVELALLQLKQLLQIPAGEPFDIQTPELETDEYEMIALSADEVFHQAETTQPEIKSADANIESAEYGLKIAQGAHQPTLSMSGSIGSNYSSARDIERYVANGTTVTVPESPIGYIQGDPSQVVVTAPYETDGYDVVDGYSISEQWDDNLNEALSINLSIPVFNGGKTRANVQRAKIQKEMAKINAQERRNVLRQTIESAYNDAKAASKVFGAAEKQVEALEESFRATEKSYNLGASNFVDYQMASFNLFSAKSSLVRAKFDYIFKLKVLDFYLGNPLTL